MYKCAHYLTYECVCMSVCGACMCVYVCSVEAHIQAGNKLIQILSIGKLICRNIYILVN